MQSVFRRCIPLLFARSSTLGISLGGEPILECIQDSRYVIDELCARNGGCRREGRVRINGASPGSEDDLAALSQVHRKRLE
jgi:hypothetical protein